MLVDFLPRCVHAGRMQKVAVVVQDGAEPFGLGAMCEVWAEPYHPEDDNPVFDFIVATPRPGGVRTARRASTCTSTTGWTTPPTPTWSAWSPSAATSTRRRRWSSSSAVRPRRAARCVFAHCSAAFMLGEAGLLDGRRVHDALAPRRRARGPLPRGDRRRQRALRPGRLHRHRCRVRRRPRRGAARDAPAVRRQGRRHHRAAHGRPAAPRRRPGPVHRPPGAGVRVRGAGAAARLDQRPPRRGARRRDAGPPDAHVGAHLRPALQGGDRHDALQLDPGGAGARRARSCSSRPTTRSTGSPARSASATPPPCATTSVARAASARRSTGAPSG